MAPDLLSTIAGEIEERLAQLRPLNAEYEQLLVAAEALESERAAAAAPKRRTTTGARRGRPATAKRGTATSAPVKRGAAASATPKRSARGAAREAILGALDHGSHTVAELAIVTAMKPANISGNLRRLLAEGAVHKTGREGKTAYALPGKR